MATPIELPKTYLVVLALYRLGGEADLETIAVKAHEMFPQEFSWRNYPALPDKDAVRVHLSEAKKRTFGVLVADRDLRHDRRAEGGYQKRFALTQKGLEKATELEAAVGMAPLTASKNPIDSKRLIEPLIESAAYRQYSGGRAVKDIGRDSFLLGFKLFADANKFVVSGRLTRAETAVARLPNSQQKDLLLKFIKEGRNAFDI